MGSKNGIVVFVSERAATGHDWAEGWQGWPGRPFGAQGLGLTSTPPTNAGGLQFGPKTGELGARHVIYRCSSRRQGLEMIRCICPALPPAVPVPMPAPACLLPVIMLSPHLPPLSHHFCAFLPFSFRPVSPSARVQPAPPSISLITALVAQVWPGPFFSPVTLCNHLSSSFIPRSFLLAHPPDLDVSLLPGSRPVIPVSPPSDFTSPSNPLRLHNLSPAGSVSFRFQHSI